MSELQTLERKLAYDRALSDIHWICECYKIDNDDWWCDIDNIEDEGEQLTIKDAVRYLEFRGLLERHPDKKHLARILNQDD